ncbi:hypothetical protein JMJ35_000297 [Cladonia borealis]|uniref:Uncharacterized protein n=1 Tax=Cladonia borealis TaxID=184061 RepID=A0AA39R917_9LECA|nr:hypothetical protein JMJ35_000297 [Cladonia borealis]
MLILGGSFFLSNAIYIWNDWFDAPLDALVERIGNRPIPRGAVSPFDAAVFTTTQVVGAALFLPYLSTSAAQSAIYALPGIISYPWAKRHIDFPQAVLGFCMGWGVIMGSVAIGIKPVAMGVFGSCPKPRAEYSTMCLFSADAVWPMIYDTIYARQDLKEELKVGIKSLAVLYGDRTKVLLWQLLTLMITLLFTSGWLGAMGVPYFLVTVGGATMSIRLMIVRVDLDDTKSCWWWFSDGFWIVGGPIAGGLLAEYIHQNYLLYSIWIISLTCTETSVYKECSSLDKMPDNRSIN